MAFELVGLACALVHHVVDYGPRSAPTLTDRPVCVRPQRWDDDGYLGPSCEDYNCTSFSSGTRGKTCNCKTQKKTHILKIARPGHYCALGDEWNTLHRLVNASCVVKPFNLDPTIDHRVVRARRIIRMTKAKGKPLSHNSTRGLECNGVRRTFEELARHGLYAHDSCAEIHGRHTRRISARRTYGRRALAYM